MSEKTQILVEKVLAFASANADFLTDRAVAEQLISEAAKAAEKLTASANNQLRGADEVGFSAKAVLEEAAENYELAGKAADEAAEVESLAAAVVAAAEQRERAAREKAEDQAREARRQELQQQVAAALAALQELDAPAPEPEVVITEDDLPEPPAPAPMPAPAPAPTGLKALLEGLKKIEVKW